ncbi:MAG: zeta toxin family protein [Rickettsiales bacterium]|jgi:predicted ABC-type ATPase|nr:zeta toxin family protein [Rickettsiales bacterium]
MKPIFYLIAGANGSGKTTLGHELLDKEKELIYLNADELAAKMDDKIGISAGKIIHTNLKEVISSRKSFVWESTISGNHHIGILEKARKAEYEIVFVYIFLDSPDVNLARIKKRVALGGHDVPASDVIRRFYKSMKNFSVAAGLVDRWKLFYNGDDNFELVAEGNKRNIEILNDDLCKKLDAQVTGMHLLDSKNSRLVIQAQSGIHCIQAINNNRVINKMDLGLRRYNGK